LNIAGKSALVTGGASGLGAAAVQHFRALGAEVMSVDINEEEGISVAESAGASFYCADVTEEPSMKEAFAEAKIANGAVQVLVNAAGFAAPFQRTYGRKGAYSLDLYKKVIDINLIGSFNCARLAAEEMAGCKPGQRGERGVIIQVSSINAFDGPIGSIAYTAAKAGVHGMTITMARDLAKYGIRVCTIAPGSFDTPMLRKEVKNVDDLLENIPFPNDQLGDPEDFAKLVIHICENPMLNGETIRLDAAARLALC